MTGIREHIAAERTDLTGTLTGLTERQWDAPTLCAGWRVREVVAHITMPYRYSGRRFLGEMLRSGGNFTKMSDRCARRDADKLSVEELTAALRDNVHHPWKPPRGGYEGALSHDVIHGLDITVPLGIDRTVPPERLRPVLDGLEPKQLKFFGADLDGIELRATDLDWSYGSGTPLSGTAQDLLLVACGRTLPPGHLHGEPSARFSTKEARS
ncbi:maleylpyruvate isomerase family mycothiol-dependent enzyme [Amycolatopsis aidingensis]|uniref:maleylpyruvate isomerase family mycothiol-dependent enzyme n=1 Tax=Amycolatopsis aidingensis TaxID=2842453 RepID=UPI001C0C0051|nr:maleylpyruvate isomerase family mycothiol-dependent enzyme [Amycolatopsis aidingensis]